MRDLLKPKATVRGKQVMLSHLSPTRKISATLYDFLVFSPLSAWMLLFLSSSMQFSTALAISLGCAVAIIWTARVLKLSLGTRLFFYHLRSGPETVRAVTLGVVAFIGAITASRIITRAHFMFRVGQIEVISRFEPKPEDAERFQILPFYYSVGAWPKHFDGKPYFYSLPYEVGPPQVFLGRVVMNLELPDIKLTIEGPKTPEKRTPSVWKSIVLGGPLHSLSARQMLLQRHMNELKVAGYTAQAMKWVEVSGDLAESAKPQGVWLEARRENLIQERVILITAQGTQQTLILDRTDNDRGALAHDWLFRVIGSLRLFDQIAEGRQWTERLISRIDLNRLPSIDSGALYIEKILEIQGALLSQMSMNPRSFDGFFHFGGTSMLLIRYFSDPRRMAENQLLSGGKPPLTLLIESLSSTFRYSKDIAPSDERVNQLGALLVEARRF